MKSPLSPGQYDALLTEELAQQCATSVEASLRPELESAPKERIPELVGRAVTVWVERELRSTPDQQKAEVVGQLTAQLVGLLQRGMTADDLPAQPLRVLRSVAGPGPEDAPPHPLTPLSETALLTNAPGEPSVGAEITHELASADAVDILMAFVRWTGIRLHLAELKSVISRGGTIRVLTTTYTNSTEQRALDELVSLGAEVKVSYNTRSTRLHAKSWLFRRASGYSTGLVGSSNLTHMAQVTGLEWNVRISAITTGTVIDRIDATFESYWNNPEFEDYSPSIFAERTAAESGDHRIDITHLDLRPYPFQERILDQLELERSEFGRWRNLVVAATGTGKTVIAALDYRRLCRQLGPLRLLVVAHRREILQQSRSTFRAALRRGDFGELWVAGRVPREWDHVFASVQTLNRADLDSLKPERFDVIIVDEFHHSAAPSYQALLDHFQPKVLLALTATPERTDRLDITGRFGGRFAAELRLWDALDLGLLTPFHYFGIHDDVDLTNLSWQAGKYSVEELENLYTGDTIRVGKIIDALQRTVVNPKRMRALGFCATVRHAEFMAESFNRAGLAATAVSGGTPERARDEAIAQLASGALQAIFTRDVFNEGVDIPEVDTVLLLRPTESATIYLQQLGRGLRKMDGKEVLTVLDFIGQHRAEYRLDERFRKLLKGSRTEVIRQIEEGFPFLPAGCSIDLDRVSKDIVLNNIRNSLPSRWLQKRDELKRMGTVTLSEFLDGTGLELADVYRGAPGRRGWTDLRRDCGQLEGIPAGPEETHLEGALGRMLHVDDLVRLRAWQVELRSPDPPNFEEMSVQQQRLNYQLYTLLWGTRHGSVKDGFDRLWRHEAIMGELLEIIDLKIANIDHKHANVNLPSDPENPLQTHACYTRDEILAAFGLGWPDQVPSFREGVKWIEPQKTDIFLITLDKSEGGYSPTTSYRDYALSRELFHWESQSMISVASPTGKRYLTQRESKTNVMLFVRERKKRDGVTMPYLCLGLADYVAHRGDRPIAITYRLRQSMPPDFYVEAKAAAG